MRRWNGWGEESITSSLSPSATTFLQERIGVGIPPQDATRAEVEAQIPQSRLPGLPVDCISTDPCQRLLHARGQSLADWIALRSGKVGAFPDGVAYPETATQVRELLDYAQRAGIHLIPYGGGTSVVGHINPLPDDEHPVLTVDVSRMNQLRVLDEQNQLATFGAGVSGLQLEAQLRARGYTLGHFPQSFEYSTLGGWIMTRSSGQQSLGYGRIEQLFAGGYVETPQGMLEVPVFPASAAGMDLREIVLGSEGRLGILTEATVRVRKLPEAEAFLSGFFPTWEQGVEAARQMVQARIPLTMLRLSTPAETTTQLKLAGHEQTIQLLEKFLTLRGIGTQKCLILVGLAAQSALVGKSRRAVLSLLRKHKGVSLGNLLAKPWLKNRFRSAYVRNTLWEMGYAVDTLETATTWNRVPATVEAIERALREVLEAEGERIHVFTHLSHLYPQGSAIYTTYLYRLSADPQETLRRWHMLKQAASQAIVAHHGTISHQHGVGRDHMPYLQAEKGEPGLAAIRQFYTHFDPQGIMNPGKLV